MVKLAGCDDRETVANYTNCEIEIDRKQLPELQTGSYYWKDLEGLTVSKVDGETLGKIDYLFDTGANDVMVIKGKEEHMIPYLANVVKRVDLDKKEMVVDWDPLY